MNYALCVSGSSSSAIALSAKGDAQVKVQRSKVCVLAQYVARRFQHLRLNMWAKEQHLVHSHLELLEPVDFMTRSPVRSCSLFSIVADLSQREVRKQLMADILSVFWQNSEGKRDKPVGESFVSSDSCCGIWEAGAVRRSPGNSYIDNGWHRWD